MQLNIIYYLCLVVISLNLYFSQIKNLDVKSPESCLKTFKSNNFLGLIVFISLILGKI